MRKLPRGCDVEPCMRRLLLLGAIITLAACARPGDHPINSNCTWIEADYSSLDLTKASDRRHLRFDAVTAEDVAIRWADKYYGHLPEWDPRREACMQTLFNGVAQHHGVDVATVRQYSLDRDIVVDATVILSFGILYVFVVHIFVTRIRQRFPAGEPGFWIMTLAMAGGVSLVAVMGGYLWSIIIEEFRLNSGHLSYRMARIPSREHWVVLLVCCFVIFVLTALVKLQYERQQLRTLQTRIE